MGRKKKAKITLESLRGCIENYSSNAVVRVPIWTISNAISLLEREQPAKPIVIGTYKRNGIYVTPIESYQCPECGSDVLCENRYCGNCGKRLDWDEL